MRPEVPESARRKTPASEAGERGSKPRGTIRPSGPSFALCYGIVIGREPRASVALKAERLACNEKAASANLAGSIMSQSVCPECGGEYNRLGQHLALSSCNYPDIPDRYKRIIIGVLMGDGSITIGSGSKRGQFTVGSITKEYLTYLQETAPNWLWNGIFLDTTAEQRVEYGHTEGNQHDYYKLNSMRHPVFTQLRREWYNDGNKRYPDDLDLDPLILKHWYVTDGTLHKRAGNARCRAKIACSNESDRPETVISLIDQVGISAHHDKHGGFQIGADDTELMFDMIGDPIPGFEYKWPDRKI